MTNDSGPATVLAVDDETENSELVRRVLQARDDVFVLIANNGAEALAILRSRAVQLMILDQRMPGMTGVELAERAKWFARPPNTIMLTAFPEDPAVVAGRKAGLIQCVISKPWKAEDLLTAVDMALRMPRRR